MSKCPNFDELMSGFWWADVTILMSRCHKIVMSRCPMSKCITTDWRLCRLHEERKWDSETGTPERQDLQSQTWPMFSAFDFARLPGRRGREVWGIWASWKQRWSQQSDGFTSPDPWQLTEHIWTRMMIAYLPTPILQTYHLWTLTLLIHRVSAYSRKCSIFVAIFSPPILS